MTHLDETTVALFVEHRLPAERIGLVERHIDVCAACRELVAELGRRSSAGDAEPLALPPLHGDDPLLAIGERVGRYVVLGTLGRGGMGAVYAAFDPDLDRKVAIKLLRRGAAASSDDRARLLREAQALARISHPGVVAIHDVGTFGDQVFLAMELIAGGTLRTWLAGERRGWREVRAVLVQVARGLAAAHASGLVHRDVKPDNILVDAGGRARIGDFGLASAISASRRSAPTIATSTTSMLGAPLTMTGAVVGTPAYMAPEQLAGRPATELSDQFSFCTTMYEALHGTRPFPGATLDAIRDAFRAGEIAPGGRDVPGWLRDAVVRGLAVDPQARHRSMDALIAALERTPTLRRNLALGAIAASVVTGVVVGWAMRASPDVCGPPDTELAGGWDAAHRVAIAKAFTATGLPYATDQIQRVTTALDRYANRWGIARARACEDSRVRHMQDEATLVLRMDCLTDQRRRAGAVIEILGRADAAVVEHAVNAVAHLEPADRCDDLRALRERVRPPTDPLARVQVDELAGELAEIEAARHAGKVDAALLARHRRIVERTRSIDYPPIRARAQYWLAVLDGDLEDVAAAERAVREAIAMADLARDDRLRAEAWVFLIGHLAEDRGNPDEALALVPQAEAAIARAADPTLELAWLTTQGTLLTAQGKVRDAADVYRKVLVHSERTSGPDTPATADAVFNLAITGEPFAKPEDTLALARRAVELYTRAYGRGHPTTANAQELVAGALMRHGDNAGAATLLEETIAVLEGAFGRDAPAVAVSLINLASAYRWLDRPDDAAAQLDRALAIYRAADGDHHLSIAAVQQQRALLAEHRGDHVRSLELHRDSIRMVEAAHGVDHPFLGTAYYGVGQALRGSRRLREALAAFERGYAIDEHALGTDSPQLSASLSMIGGTLVELGDARAALPHLERALALTVTAAGAPSDLAELQLVLARAHAKLGDRARSRGFAEAAATAFERLGDTANLALARTLLDGVE